MSDPDELVTIYEAENATEAHLVKNLLADEEIQAVVADENEPFSLTITPTEVLVRRADESRARAVIEVYDAEQERRAERPDWTCPACGATVIGALDDCESCGAERPGSESQGDAEEES